jgi:nucleotide-binding universal stress UspA family protein
MIHARTAYLPLTPYPEATPDDAILAAVDFVASLGCSLRVTTFSVNIPQMRSPLGDLLLDVPALVSAAEARSRTECLRLRDLVQKAAGTPLKLDLATREVVLGAALDTAAAEAQYYALSVVPWYSDTLAVRDMAQALIFGSGRPTILVPPKTNAVPLQHIAIAWDESRVAARALWDVLTLLPENCQITVMVIRGEKSLSGPDLAVLLASSLEKQGFNAKPLDIALGEMTIAEALQNTAMQAGAQLLAMGGFGHSRIRDFVLGGATQGILNALRLPVLLSH